MRIVLCGSRSFGAAAYQLLADRGDDVALAVAPVWHDGHEGTRRDATRVVAEAGGVPVADAETFSAAAIPDGVDLIVAAHAHNFISQRSLDRTRLGGIGYHPSLLPRHRGRDAVRWTIAMRDPVAGGSVYWLTQNVDAGPLAASRHVMVHPGETTVSLWRRLFALGVDLLAEALADLDAGVIRQTPQDEAAATWEPSWEREPIARPDLLALGPVPDGYTVRTDPR